MQDVPNNIPTIMRQLDRIKKAFDRKIRFHNGISVTIPLEAKVGDDFNNAVEFKDLSEAGLRKRAPHARVFAGSPLQRVL